jgi:hypothetical protein
MTAAAEELNAQALAMQQSVAELRQLVTHHVTSHDPHVGQNATKTISPPHSPALSKPTRPRAMLNFAAKANSSKSDDHFEN